MPRLIVVLLLLTLAACARPAHVRLAQGELQGVRENQVDHWLGVPFAAPPVGEARWRAPGAPPAWQGVRPADRFAASCRQRLTPQGFGPWTHEYVIQGPVSEDCLYANIWAPRGAKKLPVMVWIYGGGFNSGGGSVDVYDGTALARRGIVVVNFNYRVGVYGFLAHPGLTQEAGVSGNYGLMDQIAALQWVRANISAFGGDPDQVTIAGQSAGSASVHALIRSPLAKGLFVRAIAQSGSGMGPPPPPLAQGEAQGLELQRAAGAADVAALRTMSADALDAAAGGTQFRPLTDGRVVAASEQSDVPVLTGLTANETTSPDITPAEWAAGVRDRFGDLGQDALDLYPAADAASARAQWEAMARDRGLAALYLWARDRKGRAPVYAYLWNHAEPGPEAAKYKAFHSSELPYVFGNLAADRPFGDGDRALAIRTGDYWANFVKSGNPNGMGLPAWTPFDLKGRKVMELGDDSHMRPLLDEQRLGLFVRRERAGGLVSLFAD